MKKCTSQSARALIALLLCGVACFAVSGTLLALLRPERATNVSQRTLTFAERVAYQRAIEDVYWRHRIWPKERPDPKPSLDAVMSEAQLEKKVSDYLRKSQALEDYWQRPITAKQLRAEMDRMAKNTKQPDVLHELFEALGNDPFVIAECVARPALADRLLTSWYAYDQRIHGELKQRAEAELQAHSTIEQLKQASGKYSEVEFVKSDNSHQGPIRSAGPGMKLNGREWDETMQKLAATFSDRAVAAAPKAFGAVKGAGLTQIKVGIVSSLREDENRYYAVAIIEKTNDRLKLATIGWPNFYTLLLSSPTNYPTLSFRPTFYSPKSVRRCKRCRPNTDQGRDS